MVKLEKANEQHLARIELLEKELTNVKAALALEKLLRGVGRGRGTLRVNSLTRCIRKSMLRSLL